MTLMPRPSRSDSAFPAAVRLDDLILVVDDCPLVRKAVCAVLEREGHTTINAPSGEQAFQLALERQPALMLLDVSMGPGMDGHQTLARFKADGRTADLAVVMLSSRKETDDKVRGLRLGAIDYITKPFQPEEVVVRVNTHLTIQRLRQNLARQNQELAERNRQLTDALHAAARVQHALLPHEPLQIPGYTFAWSYKPCEQLGGDALDIFPIGDHHVAAYLLDVSGHGVAASLLAVSAVHTLSRDDQGTSITLTRDPKTGAAMPIPPGEVLRRMNAIFPFGERNPHFITMIYAILDTRTAELRFACAGHPGPFIVSPEGETRSWEGGSCPIGMVPGESFEDFTIALPPGTRVFFHSDGMHEERSADGRQYSRARLSQRISERHARLDSVVEGAVESVLEWAGGPASDDLSMLALERRNHRVQ